MTNNEISPSIDKRIRRIRFEGHTGSIRYVGSVDGQKGEWIGIEWDDSTRGKNNGIVNGKKYFDAKHPTSASFIRALKVPAESFGVDLLTAARQRYSISTDTIKFDRHSFGKKEIEIVGMGKISNKQHDLTKLTQIVLDSTNVERIGDIDMISKNFTSCQFLDLSCTLVNNLQTIIDIGTVIPCLKSVNCRSLKFEDINTVDVNNVCPNITELILHHCYYRWTDVAAILLHFPNIESIGLMHNNIDCINTELPALLKSLDLESNPINDWMNIQPLAKARNLIWLNLSQCPLRSITLMDGDLPLLEELILRQSNLDDWETINSLAVNCKNLKKLILTQTPLYGTDPKQASHNRQQVLGRFPPTLTHLDREQISKEERRGAYIDYIKAFASHYLDAKCDLEKERQFTKDHPFYQKLVDEYGLANSAEIKELKLTGALIDRIVNVTIKWMDKSTEKQLPNAMTVGKVRTLLARLCRYKAKHLTMHLTTTDGQFSVLLDNDSRQLQFYSIEDNNIIRVEP